jgi:hypothetical protein
MAKPFVESVLGVKSLSAVRVRLFMKALALRIRGENKDAYDLVYLLQNFGHGVEPVSAALKPLLIEAEAQEALKYLAEDFETVESVGPCRAAEFLLGTQDDDAQADAWGVVRSLLDLV